MDPGLIIIVLRVDDESQRDLEGCSHIGDLNMSRILEAFRKIQTPTQSTLDKDSCVKAIGEELNVLKKVGIFREVQLDNNGVYVATIGGNVTTRVQVSFSHNYIHLDFYRRIGAASFNNPGPVNLNNGKLRDLIPVKDAGQGTGFFYNFNYPGSLDYFSNDVARFLEALGNGTIEKHFPAETRYRNVYWVDQFDTWIAKYTYQGIIYHVGSFSPLKYKEAAKAVDAHRIQHGHWGPFNFHTEALEMIKKTP
jgi:hypothetical protein